MTIHDELIAKTLMAKPETDEDYLNIDWDTRLITIPSTLTNIGVYNDKDTNRLYFRCPIEYGEFKIADFGLRVNYQNTGISTTKYDGDVYLVDDVESDGEYLTFSWLVGRHAYLEQGTTAFIVCCKVVDSDNNVVNELNTTIATLSVLEGLEVDVLPPEDYPDYLEEILRRCEDAENVANEALEKAGVICGVCDTDADEITKEVTIDRWKYTDGAVLAVRFTKGNTVDGYTEIVVNEVNPHRVAGDARCPENSVVFFVYDSSQSAFIVDAGLTRANSAITSITVNGESVPVEDNTAEITVGGGSNIYVYETTENTNINVGGVVFEEISIDIPNGYGTPSALTGIVVKASGYGVSCSVEEIEISGNTLKFHALITNGYNEEAILEGLIITVLCTQ